jgi:hypothetical protein
MFSFEFFCSHDVLDIVRRHPTRDPLQKLQDWSYLVLFKSLQALSIAFRCTVSLVIIGVMLYLTSVGIITDHRPGSKGSKSNATRSIRIFSGANQTAQAQYVIDIFLSNAVLEVSWSASDQRRASKGSKLEATCSAHSPSRLFVESKILIPPVILYLFSVSWTPALSSIESTRLQCSDLRCDIDCTLQRSVLITGDRMPESIQHAIDGLRQQVGRPVRGAMDKQSSLGRDVNHARYLTEEIRIINNHLLTICQRRPGRNRSVRNRMVCKLGGPAC